MSQQKICPQCGTEYELDQRFCPRDGSTLRSQGGEHDLVGSIVADRYHVLRKLGEGGMGQVYLAEHVKMGRKSAVKVMNPGMVHDADAISRFNREAANASRISHPNVAAVYDFGETGEGLIYLAMEFVEGPPLTQLIAQQGSLPPLRAAEIARQVADALAVAHDMGIVHRDLKPDNIMVARNRDGTDLVKVVDFGIAKAANNDAQKVTRTGLVVGTPEYMSPEQLAGDKLDGRSDIYSLGLVTFTMLTGTLPFPSESAQETMIMRLTDQPKRLSEMKPETSWTPEVQAVMDRALARDASQRYQSAGDFGRDLVQAVAAMPQSAAAAAGTQVLDQAHAATARALPSTRVSSTTALPAGGGIPAATPAGKSRAPLIAAIATVVVLGGGGTAVMLMKGHAAPAPTGAQPPDSASLRSGSTPAQPPGGGNGGGQEQRVPKTSEPPNPTGAGNSTTAPNPPGNTLDDELRRIEKLADPSTGTASTGARAWLALDSVASLARTPDEIAHVDLLRSYAKFLQNDMQGACDWARRGLGIVKSKDLKDRLDPIAANCN